MTQQEEEEEKEERGNVRINLVSQLSILSFIVYEIEFHTDESLNQFEHDGTFFRLDQLRVQLLSLLISIIPRRKRRGGEDERV